MITIRNKAVWVNGIKFGATYSSDALAKSEGEKVQKKYYPNYKLVVATW